MSARKLLTIALTATCIAALWSIFAEGRQLSELRAEQKRLEAPNPETNNRVMEIAASPLVTPEVPRELLQLRAEVARLSAQQRELASARPENERLRIQVENRRTNSTGAKGIGTLYTRKSDARWVGYSTPENTLQSFFWAVHNHDMTKFLETLDPEKADRFKERVLGSSSTADEFFKSFPPGFAIVGRREDPNDGSMRLDVQIIPDMPPEPFVFRQIAGQWKLQPPL
jgi:hypothetical protein